ncbi:hypothetical protein CC86DRAFT_386640 [Ophiobolus disseminans]|uniref:Secreted protein n=1 Tax=Ophiobolus disseminans TaxID=1469910 RepID=A0A6A6ZLH8_9PLEO|nr:hypothetical protein CC86DRAFT_386640 [Ophiobolus disseminans]
MQLFGALLLFSVTIFAKPIDHTDTPTRLDKSLLRPAGNQCQLSRPITGCFTEPHYHISYLHRCFDQNHRFGVSCKAQGHVGGQEWYCVPGCNCWVISEYTESSCADGVRYEWDWNKCL